MQTITYLVPYSCWTGMYLVNIQFLQITCLLSYIETTKALEICWQVWDRILARGKASAYIEQSKDHEYMPSNGILPCYTIVKIIQ